MALDLRRRGYLLTEIAAEMGISAPSTVAKLIKKALREIVREPAEDVMQIELDRLDSMFVSAYARASDKGQPFNRDAVETCLKVMERRAKLLGIDKPTKTSLTDPSGEQEAAPIQFYIPENGRE